MTGKAKKVKFPKDLQYYKFCSYGFLKNLRFFDPFIILFFLQTGINYVEIGILFSFREIGTNILEIPSGIFADSFGRKKSMILSFSSYIFSFLIFYLFSNLYLFFLGMLFFSLGEAFRTGTHKAMILRYLELKNIRELKVHYYGHTRGASQLGSAMSSLIAVLLVIYTGSYKIIFIGSVIPYILGLFLLSSYPKELDSHLKPFKDKFWQEVRQRLGKTLRETRQGFKLSGQLVRGVFSFGIFSGLFKGIKDYIQPLIKSYALTLPLLIGLDQKDRTSILIGFVYFTIYLLTALVSKRSGIYADRRIGTGKVCQRIGTGKLCLSLYDSTYILGTLFLTASGVMLIYKLYELSILFFLIIHLVEGLRKPLQIGFISDKAETEVMATTLSAVSLVKTISTAIISVLIGVFIQTLGLSYAIIIVSSLVLFLYPLLKLK